MKYQGWFTNLSSIFITVWWPWIWRASKNINQRLLTAIFCQILFFWPDWWVPAASEPGTKQQASRQHPGHVHPRQVDLAGPVQEWKDLAPVDDGSNQYLGDLCISLRYVPSSGKLTGEQLSVIRELFLTTPLPSGCVGGAQAEEDGHHWRIRPVRQAEALWCKEQENWKEEEDEREELQLEPLLERVLRVHHRRDGYEESDSRHHGMVRSCLLSIWLLFVGVWLRSDRWRRSHWEDHAGMDPEQVLQTRIQALEGGIGESTKANH